MEPGTALRVHAMNRPSEYVYHPYPKWIVSKDGVRMIVQSEQEEKLHTGAYEPDHRESLLAKARALGLKPHHKLSVEKLKELIAGNT